MKEEFQAIPERLPESRQQQPEQKNLMGPIDDFDQRNNLEEQQRPPIKKQGKGRGTKKESKPPGVNQQELNSDSDLERLKREIDTLNQQNENLRAKKSNLEYQNEDKLFLIQKSNHELKSQISEMSKSVAEIRKMNNHLESSNSRQSKVKLPRSHKNVKFLFDQDDRRIKESFTEDSLDIEDEDNLKPNSDRRPPVSIKKKVSPLSSQSGSSKKKK